MRSCFANVLITFLTLRRDISLDKSRWNIYIYIGMYVFSNNFSVLQTSRSTERFGRRSLSTPDSGGHRTWRRARLISAAAEAVRELRDLLARRSCNPRVQPRRVIELGSGLLFRASAHSAPAFPSSWIQSWIRAEILRPVRSRAKHIY